MPSESGFADGSGASVAEFDFNVPLTNVAKFIIGTRTIAGCGEDYNIAH